ncbi:MAG: MerR family transcriptional regulator [Solirubrobacterales bacterium]|nr:MerR family transcriptional regulator [Solirubrobacterales bacterium]
MSPNTLRSWERRFGFPEPRRTAGGHRQFDLAEIEALRAAFEETHNISSAISVARQRGSGPTSPARLRSAFSRYDEDGANRLLEESLTVRSVERTVEEVLLPAVEELGPEAGQGYGPEYGFAWRFATGWLAASMRVAPPASRGDGILVFDASRPPSADALHAQAFELLLRRAGLRTLTLTADIDPSRLVHAITALEPRAVVLTGQGASLDALGRLVYTARRVSGDEVVVVDYRGAIPHAGSSTVERLADAPLAARDGLLERLDGRSSSRRFPRRDASAVGL